MSTPSPRRSSRQTWAKNPSFGRDYLATALGWLRVRLDNWLLSDTVYPNLVFWHSTCVQRARRHNESIEWIKTGYFYNDGNLEEDVLLLCLEEGNQGSAKDAGGVNCNTYGSPTTRTSKWTTVELWARSVWRIAQDNSGKGAVFESTLTHHPAKAYGTVIDMLCLAFHNIALVGPESVWSTIIKGKCVPVSALTPSTMTSSWYGSQEIARQMAMDVDPDTTSEEDEVEHFEQVSELDEIFSASADSEFSSASEVETESVFVETPKRTRGAVGRKSTPTAPSKQGGGNKRVRAKDVEDGSPSKKIKQWVQSVPCHEASEEEPNNALNIFDENGLPITGYRSASTIQAPKSKPSVGGNDLTVRRRD